MAYTFKYGDRPIEGLTVQRAVGRGGFGEVYYAVADSGKQVALKYLRENPEIELRGISQVMNLKSPHLITIYDVRRNTQGEPFVVMEYVSGPSLRDLLTAEAGGLGAQKAAFFVSGIAKGLAYLHERGIVHRDLKPANIFYDDGYVKIGDYGLSKHISVSQHSGQTVSVGTVHYMAPEIGSGSYTKAIDIYALGVILYEMLTGRLPYSGSSMAEILMRHVRDAPDLAGVPQPFVPVIVKALAKDPRDRYQDANEMLAAVMDSTEIARSIESFDTGSITHVPRTPGAVADDTLTAGTPQRPLPPPPLDVRDARALDPAAAPPPPHAQRRIKQLSHKLEQKVARLERKLGPRVRRPDAVEDRPQTPSTGRSKHLAHWLTLVVVGSALAFVMGALQGGPNPQERIFALWLFLAGATAGPLTAHLRLLQAAAARQGLLDRLVYAGTAGLFMMPAYFFAREEVEGMAPIVFAPMAVVAICGWGQRIEAGRTGRVQGGKAFWPAVIGAIAAAIADADDFALTAGALCASASLLTQAAASMWPLRPLKPAEGSEGPGARAARWGSHPVAEQGAENQAFPPVPETRAPDRRAEQEATAPTAAGGGAPPPPPGEVMPGGAMQTIVTAAQPSFVGRAASSGLATLGKLLLLLGVLAAYMKSAPAVPGFGQFDELDAFFRRMPPGVALAPLAVGTLALVLARRREGAGHFLRGCLGCALLCVSCVASLRLNAAPVLVQTFTAAEWSDPDFLARNGRVILATLGPLALGLFFLLCPRRATGQTTVVV